MEFYNLQIVITNELVIDIIYEGVMLKSPYNIQYRFPTIYKLASHNCMIDKLVPFQIPIAVKTSCQLHVGIDDRYLRFTT